ncbi:MAG: nicotinate-nucleotide adenylyltransferase [Bacteroidaceae bacterium]|nr:nicotinate-nucleotide adenylyltransferase [Bacteroidaceae bacterium]
MNKQRVVIFGGSFDPIHVGHVNLATEVVRAGLASEVWFMVSPQNPHKKDSALSDENLRLQMVQLAIAKNEYFKACDFEFNLPRPSYTYNTLLELDKQYPDKEFLLLVGADNWEKFDKWYNGDEILKKYRLIVYPRGNEEQPQLPQGVTWLPAKLYNVSSTEIRTAVFAGEDISALVTPEVKNFIESNNLYKSL